MVENIKTDVDRLLLVSKIKKVQLYCSKIYLIISFTVKTKSSLSASDFIFSTIYRILEPKFYVSWV